MVPIDKPHSQYRHVYAIVRIDTPVNADQPEDSIAVVKVFLSKKEAEGETTRLNRINVDKHCTYHICITRMPLIQ
jgi:hypothetical protein